MLPAGAADVVVVPSLSLDPAELAKVTGVQFYEERALGFSLLQVRKMPRWPLVPPHSLHRAC